MFDFLSEVAEGDAVDDVVFPYILIHRILKKTDDSRGSYEIAQTRSSASASSWRERGLAS